MLVVVPGLKTVSALNEREHHMARARRVKKERSAVSWCLVGKSFPTLPVLVTLTRIAPSNGLDEGDNLSSALKGARDEVAKALGVDDKQGKGITFAYDQRRGDYAVEIRIERIPTTTTTS